jgi:MraZ protein
MFQGFHGTFEQRIDEKGRVSIPVKFRELLRAENDRLFVTRYKVRDIRCLDACTPSQWESLGARLHAREDLSQEELFFLHQYYVAGAHECQLDRQGRLLVPPGLREHAGLVKDVVFTGAGSKFHIWDRERHQPVLDVAEEVLATHPRVISILGF